MTDKDNYFMDGEGNKTPMPELDYSNKKSPTTKLEITKQCPNCNRIKQDAEYIIKILEKA